MKEDLSFARSVSSGDPEACKIFIDTYSPLVLKKIWHLMNPSHCDKPDKYNACSLLILGKQSRKHSHPFFADRDSELDQCDECMDSYIWIFDYLKRRLKAYKGITRKGDKGCSLHSYIETILRIYPSNNPHNPPQARKHSAEDYMYKGWLRKKYKRIDNQEERLPRVIRNMDKVHKEIFILLRKKNTKEDISHRLGISLSEAEEIIDRIRYQLSKAGLDDLVQERRFIPIDSQDPDAPDIDIPVKDDIEEKLIIKEIIDQLPENEALVLKLRFWNDLSVREIVDFLKRINLDIIPGKPTASINEQDMYQFLKKVIFKKIIEKVQEKNREES